MARTLIARMTGCSDATILVPSSMLRRIAAQASGSRKASRIRSQPPRSVMSWATARSSPSLEPKTV